MKYPIAFFVLLLFSSNGFAQKDTSIISLDEAEKTFLQNNLEILAARYNIDANKALIQQAKLWDNPVLNTDQNIYDGKFFQHNSNAGQVYVQIVQLIRTAGKRNKLAQLAIDNTKISEQQFNDLIRTLRFTLHTDLLSVNQLLKAKRVYDAEIAELNRLVAGMDVQLQQGNISLKENMRIKALLFSLSNELVDIQSQLIPLQSELHLLLQTRDSSFIKPVLTYDFAQLTTAVVPVLNELTDTALNTRGDAQLAQTALQYQQHNLVYQKSLAKADVSVGMEYDRLSTYAPNYIGLQLSLPLNLFNRNQGNIKSAQFSIKSQEAITNQAISSIQQEVVKAYSSLKYFQQVNNRQQLDFSKNYDSLFQNMLNSYRDRQVSLLEFIDFMDTYKDTKLKLLQQHSNLVAAVDELNYTIGKDIIKL
ncbi:MAG: TolC family protein [Sphingobacteriales bacterium]|nr:TolC family protein [Sphingobacteriales bacterium]MBI3719970.1 TolC family protein [Sphingobacteriales bacterium]